MYKLRKSLGSDHMGGRQDSILSRLPHHRERAKNLSEMQTINWLVKTRQVLWLKAIREKKPESEIWYLKEKYNEALEMKYAKKTKPKNISPKP